MLCNSFHILFPTFQHVTYCRFSLSIHGYNLKNLTSAAYQNLVDQARGGSFGEYKGDLFGEEQLHWPWNGSYIFAPSVWQQSEPLDLLSANLPNSSSNFTRMATGVLSDIILMPAPGEEFSLNILCLDQLLNKVPTTAFIQVRKYAPFFLWVVHLCFFLSRKNEEHIRQITANA